MESFRILVSDVLLSKIGEPLVILAVSAAVIFAATAVFVGIELKKNRGGNEDA